MSCLKNIKNENITFIPRLPREELFAYYQNAYAFINPTLEDTLPTVNIESLALGTPIIGYDTGGSKEIIGTCGVTVQKDDKKALLKAYFRNLGFEESPLDMKLQTMGDEKRLVTTFKKAIN